MPMLSEAAGLVVFVLGVLFAEWFFREERRTEHASRRPSPRGADAGAGA